MSAPGMVNTQSVQRLKDNINNELSELFGILGAFVPVEWGALTDYFTASPYHRQSIDPPGTMATGNSREWVEADAFRGSDGKGGFLHEVNQRAQDWSAWHFDWEQEFRSRLKGFLEWPDAIVVPFGRGVSRFDREVWKAGRVDVGEIYEATLELVSDIILSVAGLDPFLTFPVATLSWLTAQPWGWVDDVGVEQSTPEFQPGLVGNDITLFDGVPGGDGVSGGDRWFDAIKSTQFAKRLGAMEAIKNLRDLPQKEHGYVSRLDSAVRLFKTGSQTAARDASADTAE